MKKRLIYMVFALIFLVGLSLLLYPLVSNALQEQRMGQVIEQYTQQVEEEDQDARQWLQKARAYNATLEGKDVPDAFALITQQESDAYRSQLAFREDGVMGYIQIPRISVNLPIYHGTTQETLEQGAGHLEGSALPVGGENTHCVISAHRGLPSAAMFTDLDMLELGDHFYIYVLDQVLAYEVDQIKEVRPQETEDLNVQPGQDLVTLVTCTPYGVNTKRLLVRGHRVPYVQETVQEETRTPVSSVHTRYGMWVLWGLSVTAVLILGMMCISRRIRKREAP